MPLASLGESNRQSDWDGEKKEAIVNNSYNLILILYGAGGTYPMIQSNLYSQCQEIKVIVF